MIEITGVGKSYGNVDALRGVSFQIGAGEIVGLLGPNGAGKTTIMKIIAGYLHPDEGDVVVDNLDVISHPREVQANLGYLPENAPLYHELSVQSYLKMMAELRQIPESDQVARISETVLATGLSDQLTRPIGYLSKGQRQRVGIAQAIVHRPKILILDEPTIGLDPTQVVEIRQLIRRLSKNSTVLFSTHILSEVEALCDRVIILINGLVRADARLSELASTSGAILILEKKVAAVEKDLAGMEAVSACEVSMSPKGHAIYRVQAADPDDRSADLCPALYSLAREKGWPVRELRPDVRTLEMVFNDLATAA